MIFKVIQISFENLKDEIKIYNVLVSKLINYIQKEMVKKVTHCSFMNILGLKLPWNVKFPTSKWMIGVTNSTYGHSS